MSEIGFLHVPVCAKVVFPQRVEPWFRLQAAHALSD